MTDSPLFALTMARIREFAREPGAVVWTFGFPLLITVALGIAFRDQGPPQQRVAVLEGPRAVELAAALRGEGKGNPLLAVETLPADVAAARLRAGAVVLTIDGGASAGDPIVYRFDPGRPDARGGRYVDWMVPGLL